MLARHIKKSWVLNNFKTIPPTSLVWQKNALKNTQNTDKNSLTKSQTTNWYKKIKIIKVISPTQSSELLIYPK